MGTSKRNSKDLHCRVVKSYVRRTLLQAGLTATSWPLATRYVNEMMRFSRLGMKKNFPPFWSEVLVKKRRWDAQQMEPTMEKVTYVAPSPWNYGHWVKKEDGSSIVTRFCIANTTNPVSDEAWIALERQGRDPLERRRRIRGKTTVKMMTVEEEEEDSEGEKPTKARIATMIAEEMGAMVGEEDEQHWRVTMEVVARLRKMNQESEEDEVLQTRVVGMAEVLANREEWRSAIKAELDSLIEEKEALKPMRGEEKDNFFRQATREGRSIEVVPGKLVPTIKPGPGKGKKKARVVACGNFTNKDAQEDLYASTGDAVVLRIMMKKASEQGWRGASLDVKTAFLNTPWDDMGVLVRPPYILIKMGLVEEDTLWLPTKALYGFRKSPRLWGNHRDEVLRRMRIGPTNRRCRLVQFQAEPNLWRIQEEKEEILEEGRVTTKGLMMVYVDDLFAVGEEDTIKELIEAIQKEWQTSQPEWVSKEPVRFLGMEIKKVKTGEEEGGVATQHNYTRDLLRRNLGSEEETWKKRKIPMMKDIIPEVEEDPTKDQIREAQRVTGELIWLVTRTRPDLMFVVSRMASQVLRSPCWVKDMASQVWGYLNVTQKEGVIYRAGGQVNPWEESSGIQTYADASFSPGGEESHGAVVVMLRGAPLEEFEAGKHHPIHGGGGAQ